jgi:RNA polymerase sigma-70 factor, ECF subfamily
MDRSRAIARHPPLVTLANAIGEICNKLASDPVSCTWPKFWPAIRLGAHRRTSSEKGREHFSQSEVTSANTPERDRHWGELMDQSLAGNAGAYQELLVLLTVAVRSAVRGRVRPAGLDAEDVVQEVLLALHLKRGTWIPGTPVGPWVAAIARNKIVDALRRRGRRTEIPIDSVLETLSVEEAQNHEEAHDLQRALARLNHRQREVVRAVSLEGHTAHEVATRLKMSEGAVRVTLHRSLKALAATFSAVLNEH